MASEQKQGYGGGSREQDQDIPILFMTARDDFLAKQRGFGSGIDDYMVKPVDLDELLLHIGALLRRARIAGSRRLEAGALKLDADERGKGKRLYDNAQEAGRWNSLEKL